MSLSWGRKSALVSVNKKKPSCRDGMAIFRTKNLCETAKCTSNWDQVALLLLSALLTMNVCQRMIKAMHPTCRYFFGPNYETRSSIGWTNGSGTPQSFLRNAARLHYWTNREARLSERISRHSDWFRGFQMRTSTKEIRRLNWAKEISCGF